MWHCQQKRNNTVAGEGRIGFRPKTSFTEIETRRTVFRWRSCLFAGLVLSSMSQASAAIITGETATASSTIGGGFNRLPIYAVNDSGLTSGQHNNAPDGFMWLSTGSGFGGVDPDPWFTVDLGAVYNIN